MAPTPGEGPMDPHHAPYPPAQTSSTSPPPSSLVCPECDKTVAKGKQAYKHAVSHWGELVDHPERLRNPEAQARIQFLVPGGRP